MKKIAFLLSLALCSCLFLSSCGAPSVQHDSCWQVGFAVKTPEIEDPKEKTYYVAGYKNDHHATGVLDLQQIKAVYMETNGKGLLVIVVDCVGLSSSQIEKIKAALPASLRSAAHVVSTHTHAGIDTLGLWGPIGIDGKDPEYMDKLTEKAAEAGVEAYQNREKGRLYYGATEKGIEDLQQDSRKPYVYDKAVHQIRFVPENGEKGVRILNYAAHAESLRGDNTLISADFPRYLCDAVKRESGDDAVFIPAAIGGLIMTRRLKDEAGREYPVAENVVLTGEALAAAVLSIENETELAPKLSTVTEKVGIPLDNRVFIALASLGVLTSNVVSCGESRYGLGIKTDVSLLTLGDLTIVCMPGELFPELAYGEGEKLGVTATLKELLGDDFLVFGLCDDEIGYIVPPSDFMLNEKNPYLQAVEGAGENHYEETNSVGPDAALRLLDAVKTLSDRKNAEE